MAINDVALKPISAMGQTEILVANSTLNYFARPKVYILLTYLLTYLVICWMSYRYSIGIVSKSKKMTSKPHREELLWLDVKCVC